MPPRAHHNPQLRAPSRQPTAPTPPLPARSAPPRRTALPLAKQGTPVAARWLEFRTPWDKARWLDAQASLDAMRLPLVRQLARRIALAARDRVRERRLLGRGVLAMQIACDVHAFVRDAIHYRHDGQ